MTIETKMTKSGNITCKINGQRVARKIILENAFHAWGNEGIEIVNEHGDKYRVASIEDHNRIFRIAINENGNIASKRTVGTDYKFDDVIDKVICDVARAPKIEAEVETEAKTAEVETATAEQISTDAENATADNTATGKTNERVYITFGVAACHCKRLEQEHFDDIKAELEKITESKDIRCDAEFGIAVVVPAGQAQDSVENVLDAYDLTYHRYIFTKTETATDADAENATDAKTADNTATDAEATSLEEMTNEYNAAFIAFGKAKDEFYRLSISYGKTGQLDTYKDLGDAQIKLRNARARLDNINKAFDDIQIRAINKQADYLKDKITRDAQSSDDNVFELLPKVDELNDIDELTDYERDILFAKSLGELIGQRFAEKAIAELDKKKKTAIIICREFTQLDRSTQLDDRR